VIPHHGFVPSPFDRPSADALGPEAIVIRPEVPTWQTPVCQGEVRHLRYPII
jgi:hypothetical protein